MKKLTIIASLLAAVSFISCEQEKDVATDDIVIVVDNDVIKCDGKDASTLIVKADDGTVITDGVVFYDSDDNEVAQGKYTFKTDKEGTYTFWASYKTFISKRISITAVNADIPAVVQDHEKSNTSFKRKVFITKYTGTECGYCPSMTKILHGALETEGLGDHCVLAEVHSFRPGDPAYIAAPLSAAGYPFLQIDMVTSHGDYQDEPGLVKAIKGRVEAEEAKAGISVNSSFAPKLLNGYDYLIVRVQVKAAEETKYSVGAWLMEDGIYGQQDDYKGIINTSNRDQYDNHDNCVRVAESYNGKNWMGYDLGKIQAGGTAEKTFLLKINDKLEDEAKKWKHENMHLAVFVSARNSKGTYSVNNVIDCPVNEPVPFDYK